jgi:type 1 glutamine amidotransferase
MRTFRRPALALACLFALAGAARSAEPDPNEASYKWRVPDGRTHVLWVGGGHWHDTLRTTAILRQVLEGGGRFHLTYTEDTGSLARLEPYDVIVLNGMLASMAPEEEQGLLAAVRAGKPLLVLHAASASFRRPPPAKKNDPVAGHPEFYRMLGGYVEHHPPFGPVHVRVIATGHPVTQGLADFEIEDELFLFRNLEPDNEVLLETDFEGTKRPLAWARRWGEGRVLHVALGHGVKAAGNPAFQRLVMQGLAWLTGQPVQTPAAAVK